MLACTAVLGSAALLWGLAPAERKTGAPFALAFESIALAEVEHDIRFLAAPGLEGRDSPSPGLEKAADYIEERMRSAGLVGAGKDQSFRMPFLLDRLEPDPELCRLESTRQPEPEEFELGEDYVPLPGCEGVAEGELVFVGFGISSRKHRYDDLRGLRLRGRIALFLQGEPAHEKLFEGPQEVTGAADVYTKILGLEKAGVAGVIVVRRPPGGEPAPADQELGFRYTWARWNPATTAPMSARGREQEIPALEVSTRTADALLGQDVLELARRIEQTGKPVRVDPPATTLRISSASRRARVPVANVVGLVRGTDPELADEYVVIGAHYDHIGVDAYGRIGLGADDNASGTSAMLEVVEALQLAGPRRSILACAFAAEEDGLLGSEAFVDEPPVPREAMVCMINMDMVGHGEPGTAVVLGPKHSADLSEALARAEKLRETGLEKVLVNKAEHLWERSDHYPFFRRGIPSLFFFESVSEMDNPHYHTFRDTVDIVSFEKVSRIARLVFNTAWVVGNADDPPAVSRR